MYKSNILPNPSLIKFHKKYCSNTPIDSSEVFYKLIDELNKDKKRKDKNEK